MAGAVDGNKKKELNNESISKFCDVCKEGNDEQEAVGFCWNCDQYLCAMCKLYHQRLATTRAHTILGVTDLLAKSTREENESSEEIKWPTCNKHHGLTLEFYCEEHNSTICTICKIADHRKCQNIELLTNISKKSSKECLEMVDYIKFIEKSFEKMKTAKVTEKSELIAEISKITSVIKEKRKELDRLEEKALQEVKDIFKQESKVIDQETEVIEHSLPLISAKIKHLENINKSGTAEETFLATKSASNEVRKLAEILHDTKSVSTRTINFKENDELSKIDTLGELTLRKTDIDVEIDLQDNFLVTNTPSDKKESVIVAMGSLSDGKQMLLDFTNAKVKLFSERKFMLNELVLPDRGSSMVVLNDNEAIVAIPDKGKQSLQKVNIRGKTQTLGSCIPTKLSQWLVTKYSDTSLLTLARDGTAQQFYLQIIDHNGSVDKSTKLDCKLLTQPLYIAASVNRTKNLVYIVDHNNGCFGFTLDGNTVFHHTEDIYNIYRGVVVDEEECIYIGCGKKDSTTGNIVKLSPVGTKMKSVFCKDKKARVLPLKCTGKKLFVRIIDENGAGLVRHIFIQWIK